MALSRKQKREFTRLKNHAGATIHNQREVLEHAASVIRNATHEAANFGREDMSPRAKEAYQRRIRPAVNAGISRTRAVTKNTRDRFVDEVFPSMASALGTALAALELATSPLPNGSTRSPRSAAAPTGGGPGKYILVGLGVVALAGVAYAAWQTVRTGDDLWIADDEENADVGVGAAIDADRHGDDSDEEA